MVQLVLIPCLQLMKGAYDMKKVGDRIVDFKNERITFLHLKYDDAAEMRRDIRTYFDRIKVVVR